MNRVLFELAFVAHSHPLFLFSCLSLSPSFSLNLSMYQTAINAVCICMLLPDERNGPGYMGTSPPSQQAHTCRHTCRDTHTHKHTRTQADTNIQTHTSKHSHMQTHKRKRTCTVDTCRHTHVETYIHTKTRPSGKKKDTQEREKNDNQPLRHKAKENILAKETEMEEGWKECTSPFIE